MIARSLASQDAHGKAVMGSYIGLPVPSDSDDKMSFSAADYLHFVDDPGAVAGSRKGRRLLRKFYSRYHTKHRCIVNGSNDIIAGRCRIANTRQELVPDPKSKDLSVILLRYVHCVWV